MGGMPTHVPVLRDRVLALLAPAVSAPGAVVVDATLGLAGHSLALLAAHPGLRLIGIDRDPDALRIAGDRLASYGDRVSLHQAVYDELPAVLAGARVDGVLFDLGVSSMQLDQAGRGFAYAQDAPLDMRMSSAGTTAADVVNGYSTDELTRVLRDYGEEKFARRIAQFIVRERAVSPITSSARLVDLVRDAIPAAARRTGGNPAKRTFQALRIEVNRELDALQVAVPAALDAVRVGGRVVVLSYHSLEDRIVKRAFAAGAEDRTPPGLPVPLASAAPVLRVLTRGAEPPTDTEIAENPRAASAKLRAAERLREAA